MATASLGAVTWWAWTLLWIALLAGAALVLYLAARRLLRQGLALARELGAAAELLAEVTRTLESAHDESGAEATPVERPPPAVRRRPSARGSSSRRRRGASIQDVR